MGGRTIEISGIPFIPDEKLLVDFLEDVLGNGCVRACRLVRSNSLKSSSSNRCKAEGDKKLRAIVETESAESATTLHNLAKARILVFWCAALAVKFVSCPDPDHSFAPDLNIHDVPLDPETCVYEQKICIKDLPLELPDVEQKYYIDTPLEPDVEQKYYIEDLQADVEQKSSIEDLPLQADVEQKSPKEDLPLEPDIEQKSSIEDPQADAEHESSIDLPLEADVEQKCSIEDLPLESDVEQKISIEDPQADVEHESSIDLPLEADVEQKCSIEDLPLEADVIVSEVAPDVNISEPKQLPEPRVSVPEVVHEPKSESGPKYYVPAMFGPIPEPKSESGPKYYVPAMFGPIPEPKSSVRSKVGKG